MDTSSIETMYFTHLTERGFAKASGRKGTIPPYPTETYLANAISTIAAIMTVGSHGIGRFPLALQ
jgi:hypothetical protein